MDTHTHTHTYVYIYVYTHTENNRRILSESVRLSHLNRNASACIWELKVDFIGNLDIIMAIQGVQNT